MDVQCERKMEKVILPDLNTRHDLVCADNLCDR